MYSLERKSEKNEKNESIKSFWINFKILCIIIMGSAIALVLVGAMTGKEEGFAVGVLGAMAELLVGVILLAICLIYYHTRIKKPEINKER